jgi:hypothetical protein
MASTLYCRAACCAVLETDGHPRQHQDFSFTSAEQEKQPRVLCDKMLPTNLHCCLPAKVMCTFLHMPASPTLSMTAAIKDEARD